MAIRFDLTDLRLFIYVAEAANITQGAQRANMALASASERIRGMEDTLGLPLLERKRRGVRLTPAGSALVQHARVVMQQLEQMRDDLNKYAKGLRAHIRVLANTVATVEFLPTALVPFLAAHPNIDVDLEERQSREIVRAIAEGHGDIGIVADPVDPAEQLETFPFAEDRLVLVVPRRHPLSRHSEIAFRESLDNDFVGLAAGSALQETLNHHAARAGRQLRLRVRLNGFLSLQMLSKQIEFALHNYSMDDQKLFDFFKRLEMMLLALQQSKPGYDDCKGLCRFIWEIFAGWDWIEGDRGFDLIEKMIGDV